MDIDTCNALINWCRGVAAIEAAVMEAAGEQYEKGFTHLSMVLPEAPACGANGMAWLGVLILLCLVGAEAVSAWTGFDPSPSAHVCSLALGFHNFSFSYEMVGGSLCISPPST